MKNMQLSSFLPDSHVSQGSECRRRLPIEKMREWSLLSSFLVSIDDCHNYVNNGHDIDE